MTDNNQNKPIRIMVVDDEPPIRKSLANYLEDLDFEVISAETAEESLDFITNSPCDVAIVDLRLPGMNGDALILHAHKICPSLRFLIHTGSVGYHLSKELKAIGMKQEHVFLKPVSNLILLVEAVNKLMKEDHRDAGQKRKQDSYH